MKNEIFMTLLDSKRSSSTKKWIRVYAYAFSWQLFIKHCRL